MTKLQSRNDSTARGIEAINAQMVAIQEQLKSLTQQLRITQQQHKAQETLAKEWQGYIKSIKKSLKDACSVYESPEALDDMLGDITEIVEEVKAEFDNHAQSDRYLNQVTAENEDAIDEVVNDNILSITETMPKPDDDEVKLSTTQVLTLFGDVPKDALRTLATINHLGRLTSPRSIANALSKNGITRHKLEQQLRLLSSSIQLAS